MHDWLFIMNRLATVIYFLRSAVCVDFDIFISGYEGSMSFINGFWTLKGTHEGRPYYTQGDRFLYSDGFKWLIVRELGSKSAWAYVDIDQQNLAKFNTPAGTPGWKVLNRGAFLVDPNISLERSYGNFCVPPDESIKISCN